jgi:hypothetical protein
MTTRHVRDPEYWNQAYGTVIRADVLKQTGMVSIFDLEPGRMFKSGRTTYRAAGKTTKSADGKGFEIEAVSLSDPKQTQKTVRLDKVKVPKMAVTKEGAKAVIEPKTLPKKTTEAQDIDAKAGALASFARDLAAQGGDDPSDPHVQEDAVARFGLDAGQAVLENPTDYVDKVDAHRLLQGLPLERKKPNFQLNRGVRWQPNADRTTFTHPEGGTVRRHEIMGGAGSVWKIHDEQGREVGSGTSYTHAMDTWQSKKRVDKGETDIYGNAANVFRSRHPELFKYDPPPKKSTEPKPDAAEAQKAFQGLVDEAAAAAPHPLESRQPYKSWVGAIKAIHREGLDDTHDAFMTEDGSGIIVRRKGFNDKGKSADERFPKTVDVDADPTKGGTDDTTALNIVNVEAMTDDELISYISMAEMFAKSESQQSREEGFREGMKALAEAQKRPGLKVDKTGVRKVGPKEREIHEKAAQLPPITQPKLRHVNEWAGEKVREAFAGHEDPAAQDRGEYKFIKGSDDPDLSVFGVDALKDFLRTQDAKDVKFRNEREWEDKVRAELASRKNPKLAGQQRVVTPAEANAEVTFVKGRTRKLGEINHDAKGQDPERFVPKRTLADGVTPVDEMPVMHQDGRTGVLREVYQAYGAVKWDDGTSKVTAFSKLNARGSAPETEVPETMQGKPSMLDADNLRSLYERGLVTADERIAYEQFAAWIDGDTFTKAGSSRIRDAILAREIVWKSGDPDAPDVVVPENVDDKEKLQLNKQAVLDWAAKHHGTIRQKSFHGRDTGDISKGIDPRKLALYRSIYDTVLSLQSPFLSEIIEHAGKEHSEKDVRGAVNKLKREGLIVTDKIDDTDYGKPGSRPKTATVYMARSGMDEPDETYEADWQEVFGSPDRAKELRQQRDERIAEASKKWEQETLASRQAQFDRGDFSWHDKSHMSEMSDAQLLAFARWWANDFEPSEWDRIDDLHSAQADLQAEAKKRGLAVPKWIPSEQQKQAEAERKANERGSMSVDSALDWMREHGLKRGMRVEDSQGRTGTIDFLHNKGGHYVETKGGKPYIVVDYDQPIQLKSGKTGSRIATTDITPLEDQSPPVMVLRGGDLVPITALDRLELRRQIQDQQNRMAAGWRGKVDAMKERLRKLNKDEGISSQQQREEDDWVRHERLLGEPLKDIMDRMGVSQRDVEARERELIPQGISPDIVLKGSNGNSINVDTDVLRHVLGMPPRPNRKVDDELNSGDLRMEAEGMGYGSAEEVMLSRGVQALRDAIREAEEYDGYPTIKPPSGHEFSVSIEAAREILRRATGKA